MKKILIVAALGLMAGACTPVPSAQKNGTIVKLAQSGIMNRTWEAELIRGGSYTGGTGVQGAPFDFTIQDPALLTKVRLAFDTQQEVRIKYHQTWPAPFSSDSGGNFLDSVEIISAREGGTQRQDLGTTAPTPVAAGQATQDPTIKAILEQNARALDQNQRLLELLEKKQ